MSVAHTWGSTAAERQLPFPCDRHIADPRGIYYRAVDVEAPAPVVFRWLCQLRLAPYSYDLIDNFGRRSPQELKPGLDQLENGQTFMTIFDLVEFDRGRHVTLRTRSGGTCVTYLVVPNGPKRSRLVVKLLMRHSRRRVPRAVLTRAMPWLDLVMMRRQLLNLKQLAERDAA